MFEFIFTFYDFCIPKSTHNFSQSYEEGTTTSEFAGVLYGYILIFLTKILTSFAPDNLEHIWGHQNTQNPSQVSKMGVTKAKFTCIVYNTC